MTNKLQADVSPRHIGVRSVAGPCHLCRAQGLASQAAKGPRAGPPAPDRSASSAGHQLGRLMRGNGPRLRLPGSQAFLPRVAGAFALHSTGASSAHGPASLPALLLRSWAVAPQPQRRDQGIGM